MKKIAMLIAMVAATGSAIAQTNTIGYWKDSSGLIVHNPYGECWRAGYWTPELAIPECDPAIAKPKPAPAPAPVAAPAPKVEPAPAPAPVAAPAPKPAQAPAPAPAPVKVAKKIALDAENAFASGKSELTAQGKASLDKEVLAKLGDFARIETFTVVGHADPMGKEAANVKLSKARADAVKAYLVSKGAKGDAMVTDGKGSAQPLANVKCDKKQARAKLVACYAPLRRVEIDVTGTAK